MDKDKRLWDKTRGWFEGLHVHTSYNTNEPTISKRYQPGGVASFTKNKLAYKIMGKGVDVSNLGRWSWTKFQGKGSRVLRIVTAYRPCSSGGIRSTVTQHLRQLAKDNRDVHPRKAFMDDLSLEVQAWRNEGDSIIIMGDFNENITSKKMQEWR